MSNLNLKESYEISHEFCHMHSNFLQKNMLNEGHVLSAFASLDSQFFFFGK